MRLADWFKIYREWEAGKTVVERWEKEDKERKMENGNQNL
jgi:hypothetical protein